MTGQIFSKSKQLTDYLLKKYVVCYSPYVAVLSLIYQCPVFFEQF